MSENSSNPPGPAPIPTREERLAAKLRENLRRRKVQARGLVDGTTGDAPGHSRALPKSPGKS